MPSTGAVSSSSVVAPWSQVRSGAGAAEVEEAAVSPAASGPEAGSSDEQPASPITATANDAANTAALRAAARPW